MIYLLFRLAVFSAIFYLLYRAILFLSEEVFSDTRRCSRCEGKGWWQNTRNREKCEWCNGDGRVPKDFPLQ